jgi:hypothetical protein
LLRVSHARKIELLSLPRSPAKQEKGKLNITRIDSYRSSNESGKKKGKLACVESPQRCSSTDETKKADFESRDLADNKSLSKVEKKVSSSIHIFTISYFRVSFYLFFSFVSLCFIVYPI